MELSRPFILRPIATTLLIVGVVLLGLAGYRALSVASLPSVDFPTIQVTAQLPGAGPDIVASAVTTPLEHQFGQISGLTSMTSTSSSGTSQITLQFALSRPIDAAAQDVQAAINVALGVLPVSQMPTPPTYSKVNPADVPILIIALQSDDLPLRTVANYADTAVAQKLSQITGVGLVSIEGGQKGAMRIRMRPSALAGLGLSLDDVRTAITAATVDLPKGSIDGPRLAYQIGADDQLMSAKSYGDQIIAWRNSAPVRAARCRRHCRGCGERTAGWMYDGKPAIILDVQRQPGANIIDVADSVKQLLPELRASVPPSIKFSVLTDRTVMIRASIRDVQFTLLLTAALVVMVIFVFLRKLWATVIPAVALPVSLVATFGVMAVCGFSLDNLSLMALTIASGFVVDDAIVMIENIARHLEEGEDPRTAALEGARQIGFTVVSLTVSLVAVFLPLLLMGGVVGRLFREFAVTLSVAVVISALVSLTLTPMMCAQLLKPPSDKPPGALFRWSERMFDGFLGLYDRSLGWGDAAAARDPHLQRGDASRHRCAVCGDPEGVSAGAGYRPAGRCHRCGTRYLVRRDGGAPAGRVPPSCVVDPAVEAVSSFVGTGIVNATGNTGRLFINLKPRDERTETAVQVMARLKRSVAALQGVDLFLQSVQDIQIDNRTSRTQYQYTLEDADPDELGLWAARLLTALQARSGNWPTSRPTRKYRVCRRAS